MLVLRDKGRLLFYPEKTGREEGAPIFGQFIDNKGIVQFESLQREEDILPFCFLDTYNSSYRLIENSHIKKKTITDLHPLIQILVEKKEKKLGM